MVLEVGLQTALAKIIARICGLTTAMLAYVDPRRTPWVRPKDFASNSIIFE